MNYKLNKPPIEVYWSDACSSVGWETLEDCKLLKPMECKTVGYLVQKTNEALTIALTQSIDGGVNGAIAIPTKWIKKIRTLK